MKPIRHLIVFLIFFTTACTSAMSNEGDLSTPSEWKLVSFGTSGAETPVVEGSAVTIKFNGKDQVSGNGGCNGYGGKYEIHGDKLTVKEIFSTLMACADDKVTQQESLFFKALQSATRYEIASDKLSIFYGEGQEQLDFKKQ